MVRLNENHYKEKSPVSTVEFLKQRLCEMGLEVEEQWLEESYVGTHSLRLVFKGTNIGTNGKGYTREFAAASAYAELFERFQNGILCNAMSSPRESELYEFRFDPEERYLSARELMIQNDPFIKQYSKQHGIEHLDLEERAERFKEINRLEFLQYNEEDRYTCIPFYDIRSKKVVYVPTSAIRKNYGSNGMSAGNTPEEGLVQALSEIIERVVQKKVLKENISLPDVPEEYMRKYPYIYSMFEKMKELEGYNVFMKDCSLGGKYPVAALIVVEQNTGNYGLKMGCHPDFGIAMERTFTEAAQGNDITEYTNRSSLDFFNNKVSNADNIMNSFKIGLAQYPFQIMSDKTDYEFTETRDVSNLTHVEILNNMVKDILDDGYDILVRDVSNMGFPSYHVIIPGLSELRDETDKDIRAENTRAIASLLISNISKINKENCKYVIGSLAYYSDKIMENGLASFIPDSENLQLPFGNQRAGSLYLSAMCYVFLGDYEKSYIQMRKLHSYFTASPHNSQEENKSNMTKAQITMHYVGSRSVGNTHEYTIKYLMNFYDKELCEELDSIFSEEEKVLIKQYPEISQLMENDERFKPHRLVVKLVELLRKNRLENKISQQSLQKLFEI